MTNPDPGDQFARKIDPELYCRLWARVYRAQAKANQVYGYNMERQQQGEALLAAARELDQIGDEFASGDFDVRH